MGCIDKNMQNVGAVASLQALLRCFKQLQAVKAHQRMAGGQVTGTSTV
jgi:hypothetical protein